MVDQHSGKTIDASPKVWWFESTSVTWALSYKILWIYNLWENDKFCCKLVSSGLDKGTRLDKQTR